MFEKLGTAIVSAFLIASAMPKAQPAPQPVRVQKATPAQQAAGALKQLLHRAAKPSRPH